MAQIQGKPGVEGLPKHFVMAMRTLFDIMDDQSIGYVKYSDIEKRWQDDGASGLPKGILEGLKKVTPGNGLLSFERFCAGLKICLLQIQTEDKKDGQPNRPPSAPILIADGQSQGKTPWSSPNTAAIRPNNAMSQQRTLSMPQLMSNQKDQNALREGGSGVPVEMVDARNCAEPKVAKVYGPPKPPRTGAALEGRTLGTDRCFDKSEIRTVLQNWQMGLLMNEEKCLNKRQVVPNCRGDSNALIRQSRPLGDGKTIDLQNNQLAIQSKKTLNRRREPRRHTLQNGIDYNMV